MVGISMGAVLEEARKTEALTSDIHSLVGENS